MNGISPQLGFFLSLFLHFIYIYFLFFCLYVHTMFGSFLPPSPKDKYKKKKKKKELCNYTIYYHKPS
jgi:hypothetical protein